MHLDWKDILKQTLSDEEKIKLENESKEDKEDKNLSKQTLRIELDKRQKGKKATIISGFIGNEEALSLLTKTLKTKCGSGGSYRDDEILIQGDFRDKITAILREMGHKTKTIK